MTDNFRPPGAGRKIPLNPDVYCVYDREVRGGREGCDHDFDPKPTKDESTYGEWTCTRCGLVVSYGVYQ